MGFKKSAPSRANINTIIKLAAEGKSLDYIARSIQVSEKDTEKYMKSAKIKIAGAASPPLATNEE